MNIHHIFSKIQHPFFATLPPSTGGAERFTVPEDSRTTEHGNALRFVHHFGKDLFYRHDKKRWYIWSGKRWEPDTRDHVKKLAVQAIQKIRNVELPHVNDPQEKDALAKWISKSLSKTKINNLVEMSQSDLLAPDALDTRKYLLNVQNGTVDLRTGELLDHNRDDHITKLATVNYDPGAKYPKWKAFLDIAFMGNRDLIRYFQKVMGYCLTGDTSEKCFFICYGPGGNNGKTMIINVMRGILGPDYCRQIASETLMAKSYVQGLRTDLVRLEGYRFVSASETDRQYRFDEGLVKALSGCDVITARGMRVSEVEYTPEFKLFIATNHIPKFNMNDQALLERIVVIPFMFTIPQDQRNKHMLQELLDEENEGVLAWSVEGSVMWANEGLGNIPLEDLLNVKVEPQSTFDHFLVTCCDVADNLSCSSSELYAAYLEYHTAIKDGNEPLSAASFYQELSTHHFEPSHTSRGNNRVGISLKGNVTSN